MNMNNIESISLLSLPPKKPELSQKKIEKKQSNPVSAPATLDIDTSTKKEKVTYTADMDKINSMKAETERRLIDLFKDTVKKSSLKQLSGIRGYVIKLKEHLNSESDDLSTDIDFDITDEAIKKAQADIGKDGYWGAEATSDRFLEFAIALSGDDPSKADLLIDAVKEGFKQATELWGDKLPSVSQETLTLTIEKFQAWKNQV